MFFVFSIYFFYKVTNSLSTLSDAGKFESNQVCFKILGLRDSARPVTAANVISFGLLSNDCRAQQMNAVTFTNNSICTKYSSKVLANGYFFVIDGPTNLDPVRWMVEAGGDNNTPLQLVGASEWRMFGDNSLEFFPQMSAELPEDEGFEHDVDYRPSWQWIFDWYLVDSTDGIGFFCCFVLAVLGKNKLVKPVWILFFVSSTVMIGVASLGYVTTGQARSAISCLLEMVPVVIFIIGILFWETHIIKLMFVCSFSFVVCLSLTNTLVYEDSIYFAINSVIQSAATVSFLFAVVVYVSRRRALHQAGKMASLDKNQYDLVWSKIMSSTCNIKQQLTRIKSEENMHSKSSVVSLVCRQYSRQYNRRFLANIHEEKLIPVQRRTSILTQLFLTHTLKQDSSHSVSSMLEINRWEEGSQDLCNPINSLEQLFVQASCLHPFLLEKVKGWALTSCGCFSRLESNSFAKYAESLVDPSLRFRWAKVKSVSRALEKVHRIYGQVCI